MQLGDKRNVFASVYGISAMLWTELDDVGLSEDPPLLVNDAHGPP